MPERNLLTAESRLRIAEEMTPLLGSVGYRRLGTYTGDHLFYGQFVRAENKGEAYPRFHVITPVRLDYSLGGVFLHIDSEKHSVALSGESLAKVSEELERMRNAFGGAHSFSHAATFFMKETLDIERVKGRMDYFGSKQIRRGVREGIIDLQGVALIS